MITIELPVPAYIYSYLHTMYGPNYEVKTTDNFGIMILGILEKKSIQYHSVSFNKRNTKKYVINLSISVFEKHGCYITEQHVYRISKLLDYNFRYNLFTYAIVNKEFFSIEYKRTINALLKFYNIEESELQYSTIRKDFNRKKKEIEKKIVKDNFYFFKK